MSINKRVFISGGAGFIGSNLANYHLNKKDYVLVYDNLSRKGTEVNLKWLKSHKNKKYFKFIKGDIRNLKNLKGVVKKFDVIYHMAAQVAVTTSMTDPISDFEINALGTFNMLEAFRLGSEKATFIYASTNKVYGGLDDIKCKIVGKRYQITSKDYKNGISEDRILDFHSPYGCSKGAGDQYVRDYGRVFGLNTVVFRQSCICGVRQFGNEDQGWVMHFVKTLMNNEKLSIYGNGKQIRDILYVDDLINAYQLAIAKPEISRGQIYNIGGGMDNAISLIELIDMLKMKLKINPGISYSDWREGDQKFYVSNNKKLEKQLAWRPENNKKQSVEKLIEWANLLLNKKV